MSRNENFAQGATHNIQVLNSTQRNSKPTGRIILGGDLEGATDLDLAKAAGYGPQHYGFSVARHDDGKATVSLHND